MNNCSYIIFLILGLFFAKSEQTVEEEEWKIYNDSLHNTVMNSLGTDNMTWEHISEVFFDSVIPSEKHQILDTAIKNINGNSNFGKRGTDHNIFLKSQNGNDGIIDSFYTVNMNLKNAEPSNPEVPRWKKNSIDYSEYSNKDLEDSDSTNSFNEMPQDVLKVENFSNIMNINIPKIYIYNSIISTLETNVNTSISSSFLPNGIQQGMVDVIENDLKYNQASSESYEFWKERNRINEGLENSVINEFSTDTKETNDIFLVGSEKCKEDCQSNKLGDNAEGIGNGKVLIQDELALTTTKIEISEEISREYDERNEKTKKILVAGNNLSGAASTAIDVTAREYTVLIIGIILVCFGIVLIATGLVFLYNELLKRNSRTNVRIKSTKLYNEV